MAAKESKKTFVIGYGGKSLEHDISIITAVQIYKRYKGKGYDLKLLYQAKDGKMYIGDDLDNFEAYKNFNEKKFTEVKFVYGDNSVYKAKGKKLIKIFCVDFFINCFHGGEGENGTISALMDAAGILTSASNHVALGISMDKHLTKLACIALDILVVDFFVVSKKEWKESKDKILQAAIQFDFPVVIKPVSGGSSVGITLASTLEDFVKGVEFAFGFDSVIIVERAVINKREFNCCVFKKASGEMCVKLDEPKCDGVILSFSDKYLGGAASAKSLKGGVSAVMGVGMQSQQREEALVIKGKVKAKIINASKLLYTTLGMNGVVRFDFMLDEESGRVYLGEINAVPGSLGYYFFEDINLVEELYNASVEDSHNKKVETLSPPKIF